jgi:hypothetical protein
VSQAASAFNAGFRCRQLRHNVRSWWSPDLRAVEEIDHVMTDLDSAMIGLSSLLSDQQATTFSQLRDRLFSLEELVKSQEDLLFEPNPAFIIQRTLRPEHLPAARGFYGWSERACEDLHQLLSAITVRDNRLAAWYDIGSCLADVVHGLDLDRRPAAAVTDADLKDLLAAVHRLPPREAWQAERYFRVTDSQVYGSAAIQLIKARRDLLEVLEDESLSLAVPNWDGKVLSYRGRSVTLKPQRNGVTIQILNLFQAKGWQVRVFVPRDVEGNLSQAFNHFKKRNPPVEFHVYNNRWVDWMPNLEPR